MEVGTQIYKSVVFSTVTYAHQVWGDLELLPKLHQKYLETTQNIFLRIISQSYGPTEVLALHKELRMRNVLVELERLRTAYLAKTTTRPVFDTIYNARKQVYAKADAWSGFLPDRRRLSRRQVPDPFFERWTRAVELAGIAKQSAFEHEQRLHFASLSGITVYQTIPSHFQRRQQLTPSFYELVAFELKKMGVKKAEAKMNALWNAKCATRTYRAPATYTEPWGTDVFAAHKYLSRVEAVNLVRLKTECVRLAAFMFRVSLVSLTPCHCSGPKLHHPTVSLLKLLSRIPTIPDVLVVLHCRPSITSSPDART